MARKKLKISTGITEEKHVEKLIEEQGMEGFGIYIATLLEMKEKGMEKFNIMELQGMARRLKISRKKLLACGGGLPPPPPTGTPPRAGGEFHAGGKVPLPSYHAGGHAGAPAGDAGGHDKEEEDIPATCRLEVPCGPENWERYIDQATEDTGWLEAVAMNNYLPVKNKLSEIMTIFKRHVRAQATGTHIDSVKEVQNYFANYARAGTPTYKRLMAELAGNAPTTSPYGYSSSGRRRVAMRADEDAFRYEDVNPITGERSYCGIQIPPEAPPRPNENAVWNKDKWEL